MIMVFCNGLKIMKENNGGIGITTINYGLKNADKKMVSHIWLPA
jgi:hypothetical protein